MNSIKYLIKFNIILKIYIFHLTVVMINSDRLVKLFLIRIWLVNINKCLIQKKIENGRCLFYIIIIMISLFAHIKNYFDSTTINTS